MPTATEIGERLAPLLDREGVRLAILFGSQAAGTAGPESDIDLAVECREGRSPEDILPDMVGLLGTDRVDLVDLRRASPLLAMAIVRSGRVIHEAEPSAFAEFCSLTLRRYEDTAKLRRLRREGLDHWLAGKGLA